MTRSYWNGVVAMVAALGLAGGMSWFLFAQSPDAPTDRFVTVDVNNQKVRCKILRSWTLPNGGRAYQVKSVDSGEMITVVRENPTGGDKEAPVRVYRWRDAATSPFGAPVPPATEVAATPKLYAPPSVIEHKSADAEMAPPALHSGANKTQGPQITSGTKTDEPARSKPQPIPSLQPEPIVLTPVAPEAPHQTTLMVSSGSGEEAVGPLEIVMPPVTLPMEKRAKPAATASELDASVDRLGQAPWAKNEPVANLPGKITLEPTPAGQTPVAVPIDPRLNVHPVATPPPSNLPDLSRATIVPDVPTPTNAVAAVSFPAAPPMVAPPPAPPDIVKSPLYDRLFGSTLPPQEASAPIVEPPPMPALSNAKAVALRAAVETPPAMPLPAPVPPTPTVSQVVVVEPDSPPMPPRAPSIPQVVLIEQEPAPTPAPSVPQVVVIESQPTPPPAPKRVAPKAVAEAPRQPSAAKGVAAKTVEAPKAGHSRSTAAEAPAVAAKPASPKKTRVVVIEVDEDELDETPIVLKKVSSAKRSVATPVATPIAPSIDEEEAALPPPRPVARQAAPTPPAPPAPKTLASKESIVEIREEDVDATGRTPVVKKKAMPIGNYPIAASFMSNAPSALPPRPSNGGFDRTRTAVPVHALKAPSFEEAQEAVPQPAPVVRQKTTPDTILIPPTVAQATLETPPYAGSIDRTGGWGLPVAPSGKPVVTPPAKREVATSQIISVEYASAPQKTNSASRRPTSIVELMSGTRDDRTAAPQRSIVSMFRGNTAPVPTQVVVANAPPTMAPARETVVDVTETYVPSPPRKNSNAPASRPASIAEMMAGGARDERFVAPQAVAAAPLMVAQNLPAAGGADRTRVMPFGPATQVAPVYDAMVEVNNGYRPANAHPVVERKGNEYRQSATIVGAMGVRPAPFSPQRSAAPAFDRTRTATTPEQLSALRQTPQPMAAPEAIVDQRQNYANTANAAPVVQRRDPATFNRTTTIVGMMGVERNAGKIDPTRAATDPLKGLFNREPAMSSQANAFTPPAPQPPAHPPVFTAPAMARSLPPIEMPPMMAPPPLFSVPPQMAMPQMAAPQMAAPQFSAGPIQQASFEAPAGRITVSVPANSAMDRPVTTVMAGDRTAIAKLMQTAKESPQPSQRELAIMGLSSYEGRTRPQLVAFVHQVATTDPAPAVRAAAINALVRMNVAPDSIVHTLEALRSDTDVRVRQAITEATTAFGLNNR